MRTHLIIAASLPCGADMARAADCDFVRTICAKMSHVNHAAPDLAKAIAAGRLA